MREEKSYNARSTKNTNMIQGTLTNFGYVSSTTNVKNKA